MAFCLTSDPPLPTGRNLELLECSSSLSHEVFKVGFVEA